MRKVATSHNCNTKYKFTFNLTILSFMHTPVPREAHRFIKHAAMKGVKEAHVAMTDVCSQGGCN